MKSNVKQQKEGQAKKQLKLSQFKHLEETYECSDSIHINSGIAGKPFIGKIIDIRKSDDQNIEMLMQWYYRPEESKGGRKTYHSRKELFSSDHTDWIFKETIMGKVHVWTLPEFQSLPQLKEIDYFQRFLYLPSLQEFRPYRVPVYCVCEHPYNPDLDMIMCDECNDWYHPCCLGLEEGAIKQDMPFQCPQCIKQRSQIVQSSYNNALQQYNNHNFQKQSQALQMSQPQQNLNPCPLSSPTYAQHQVDKYGHAFPSQTQNINMTATQADYGFGDQDKHEYRFFDSDKIACKGGMGVVNNQIDNLHRGGYSHVAQEQQGQFKGYPQKSYNHEDSLKSSQFQYPNKKVV